MTSAPGALSSNDNSLPLAVRRVRALMERHGLPRYRQSPWLADATGLSYSQAHRKMNGASPWTLEDLERVATLFGETLAEVFKPDESEHAVRGVMTIGSASLDCQLWLGEPVENPRPDSLVAIKTSSAWAAVCASDAAGNATYKVERLEARPSTAERRVIAVLDDDHDLTNSICGHFAAAGYDARAFYKTAELLSGARAERYDGFVVDWIVGETSTLKLIAALREQDAASPIVVLTGQVISGVVDEADIAAAVRDFNLVFHEKPVRLSILSATLSRAFTGAK